MLLSNAENTIQIQTKTMKFLYNIQMPTRQLPLPKLSKLTPYFQGPVIHSHPLLAYVSLLFTQFIPKCLYLSIQIR